MKHQSRPVCMKLAELEKHLVDINNDPIPDRVMEQFWRLKENLGTALMGVAKVEETYYIVGPSFEDYILWSTI